MISSYGIIAIIGHFGWSMMYNVSCTCNTTVHETVKLRHGFGIL